MHNIISNEDTLIVFVGKTSHVFQMRKGGVYGSLVWPVISIGCKVCTPCPLKRSEGGTEHWKIAKVGGPLIRFHHQEGIFPRLRRGLGSFSSLVQTSAPPSKPRRDRNHNQIPQGHTLRHPLNPMGQTHVNPTLYQ